MSLDLRLFGEIANIEQRGKKLGKLTLEGRYQVFIVVNFHHFYFLKIILDRFAFVILGKFEPFYLPYILQISSLSVTENDGSHFIKSKFWGTTSKKVVFVYVYWQYTYLKLLLICRRKQSKKCVGIQSQNTAGLL